MSISTLIQLFYFLKEFFIKEEDNRRKINPFKKFLLLLLFMCFCFSLLLNTYFISRIYFLNIRITEFVSAVDDLKKDQKNLQSCESQLLTRNKSLDKCLSKLK